MKLLEKLDELIEEMGERRAGPGGEPGRGGPRHTRESLASPTAWSSAC